MRSLLAHPGARGLFGASVLGRMPSTMLGLVLLLVVAPETDSYARAGLCVTAWTAATGLTAPLLGRAVDRLGRTPVLLATAVVQAALTAALALAPADGLAFPALCVLVGASTPPLPSSARSIWPELLSGDALAAMYAADAVAVELSYLVGPALVAGVAGALDARAAIAVCALLALVGSGWFALAPVVRRSARPRAHGRADVPLLPALWPLLGAGLALVTGLAIAEVAVVGASSAAGHAALAGVVIGVWSAGGIVTGVLAGARASRVEDGSPLLPLLALSAAGLALAALAGSLLALGALLFVAGAALTPTMACLSALVAREAPGERRTEAFSWLATMFVLGGALGALAGGAAVGALGARASFLVAAAATLPALLLAATPRARAGAAAPAAEQV